MANELQNLRDLVERLHLENDKLKKSMPNVTNVASDVLCPMDSASRISFPSECLLYIPRDDKWLILKGTPGLAGEDWEEEKWATVKARLLKLVEQGQSSKSS